LRRRGGFGSSASAIGYLTFPEPAWPRYVRVGANSPSL
jgi:hypothetical protein